MKIGFIYDMVYPFSKGGAEKRVFHLASRLARSHEVHWYGLKLWDGPSTVLSEEGVYLHGVMKPPGAIYAGQGRRTLGEPVWFGASIFRWPGIRSMDVIDCSSFPFFSTFSTRVMALARQRPMLVTWHEYWGGYWATYRPRVAPIGRLVERLALRMTPRAIAVSEYTRQKLIGAGMQADHVDVVPNGIHLESIDAAPPLECGPDVLFVGRLIQEKRVDLLLRSLATGQLASLGATCWVVGDGAEARNLHALADELGLNDRVRFVPWLTEEEVYGAMKSAGVVTLLSEREGFGMVVLEAMACGTPVVVSPGTLSAAPDLVRDGETGYVVPADAEALSASIASILISPQLKREMGVAARQFSLDYDWDSVANQAEGVYCQAVETCP